MATTGKKPAKRATATKSRSRRRWRDRRQADLHLPRRQRQDAGPARRQGRRPGRDDQRRAAGARRASPSPPRPAAPTTPTASSSRPACGTRRWPRCTRSRSETGKKLGDPANPLLVSVRSGAKFSMPGMMDTVLNLGLNDETLQGLVKLTGNERFGYDAYRRFIQMFVQDRARHPRRDASSSKLEAMKHDARREVRHRPDRRRPARAGRPVQGTSCARRAASDFPDDPLEQLRLAIEAVFASWNNKRAIDLPRPEQDPARPGHRRQRRDDGLRQHGRRLRHRRRLHPRPGHRRERSCTASS